MAVFIQSPCTRRHRQLVRLLYPPWRGRPSSAILGGSTSHQVNVHPSVQSVVLHHCILSVHIFLRKCTMARLHLSVGMLYSVLEQVSAPLPHLESKWIHSLRDFLASISVSLHLDDPCVPLLRREHDQYLMDMIINFKLFTPLEIRKLNYSRLYLQAVTLADVSKPNGHELDPCFLKGTSSLFFTAVARDGIQ